MTTPRQPLRAPTRPELLLDQQRRPYFLWDVDVDVDAFRALLADPDPVVRAYWIGKLMRQAKPDDVFTFVSWNEIVRHWDRLWRHLGRRRPLWLSLKEHWGVTVVSR